MAIKIVTDSTCYIPNELKEKYDITVVSLSVVMGNEIFKETEIENDVFYKKLAEADSIPTSSQPTIDDLYKIFERIVENGDDVIGIFISSEMSGTYSTCNQVIKTMIEEKYPNARMEIIDSRSNCMQMGYAVLTAARLANENKSMDVILEEINKVINRSRFLFIPDTLEYLKKGGRIGGAAALFGTLLQIRPILTVEDGKTAVFDKVRTKQRAILRMIDKVKGDIAEGKLGELIVHHINCEEEGRALAEKVKEILGVEAQIQDIGPVIGCHVGPKAVGIAYYILDK
ncbi:MAG: DegV family protein [Clostridium sp.]|nr:DegV family protein [Clostridium sp.]